jgi:hypothetical protein
MEYTDAPSASAQGISATGSKICPRCDHLLPKDAQRCDRCGCNLDDSETVEGKASDAFAVLLSAVPGLGHIYKGHKLVGLLLMFVATPMAVGLALLAATATAGFAVLLLPLYWLAVILHVWAIEDRIGPPTKDEGEQY